MRQWFCNAALLTSSNSVARSYHCLTIAAQIRFSNFPMQFLLMPGSASHITKGWGETDVGQGGVSEAGLGFVLKPPCWWIGEWEFEVLCLSILETGFCENVGCIGGQPLLLPSIGLDIQVGRAEQWSHPCGAQTYLFSSFGGSQKIWKASTGKDLSRTQVTALLLVLICCGLWVVVLLPAGQARGKPPTSREQVHERGPSPVHSRRRGVWAHCSLL